MVEVLDFYNISCFLLGPCLVYSYTRHISFAVCFSVHNHKINVCLETALEDCRLASSELGRGGIELNICSIYSQLPSYERNCNSPLNSNINNIYTCMTTFVFGYMTVIISSLVDTL